MGCSWCKKKSLTISCKMCLMNVCFNCIHLEKHMCKGIVLKKQENDHKLKDSLIKVVADKMSERIT